jgi:hypothetical protein
LKRWGKVWEQLERSVNLKAALFDELLLLPLLLEVVLRLPS